MMRSCLYECTVAHHRLAPVEHRFRYRIFMFGLDLDELDTVAAQVIGFGHGRRHAYSFRDADYLGPGPGTVKEKLVTYVARQGAVLPADARILFITLPRVFGYIFNPVCFFFCSDAGGNALCAVIQVGNTFGEKKLYFLPQPCAPDRFRLVTPKHFYVSPFTRLDLEFDFRLRVPGDELEIYIDDLEGDQRLLVTSLTGRAVPLTSARLAWFTLKYPFITLRVITLIHWQALRLWGKRIPWFGKGDRLELQREVLHPHGAVDGKEV